MRAKHYQHIYHLNVLLCATLIGASSNSLLPLQLQLTGPLVKERIYPSELPNGILEMLDPGPAFWTRKCWTLDRDFSPKRKILARTLRLATTLSPSQVQVRTWTSLSLTLTLTSINFDKPKLFPVWNDGVNRTPGSLMLDHYNDIQSRMIYRQLMDTIHSCLVRL